MNEHMARNGGFPVREDEPGLQRAGHGWSGGGYQNSSGGGIANTLDASYYKGAGTRHGKEREFVAICIGNGQTNNASMREQANTLDCMHDQQAVMYQSADKPTQDNVMVSKKRKRKYIVRRLTPLECCRLQGFPDGWMDGVEGSDSAKYKAWGNSIAIPCADDVLGRITRELRNEKGSDTEHDND